LILNPNSLGVFARVDSVSSVTLPNAALKAEDTVKKFARKNSIDEVEKALQKVK
jgi:hypothetical protein